MRYVFALILYTLAVHSMAQVPLLDVSNFFQNNPQYYSDGFDYPVGKPNAKNYYNAQPFTKNNHLGDDWNGTGGGNSDLGDPVYACANGYVTFAQNVGGGWGNIVRIVHVISREPLVVVESLYAHLNEISTDLGPIKRGDQLGTIGNNDGMYYAHLHFEIRTQYGLDIGPGYSSDTTGYTNPTYFIKAHRPHK